MTVVGVVQDGVVVAVGAQANRFNPAGDQIRGLLNKIDSALSAGVAARSSASHGLVRAAERFVEIWPSNTLAFSSLARVHIALGNRQKAIDALRRTLALNPLDTPTKRQLAVELAGHRPARRSRKRSSDTAEALILLAETVATLATVSTEEADMLRDRAEEEHALIRQHGHIKGLQPIPYPPVASRTT